MCPAMRYDPDGMRADVELLGYELRPLAVRMETAYLSGLLIG